MFSPAGAADIDVKPRLSAASAEATDGAAASRLRYIPELDGIRAIAIGFVFLVHTMPLYFTGGFIGVDIFFALSGYLITMILCREFENTKAIDLGNFYVRRMVRLMPALLAMLSIYVLLVVVRGLRHHADHFVHDNTMAALLALLYVMNWAQAFNLGPSGSLLHTWSLAMEEQFYIAWPIALILLLRFIRLDALWKAVLALMLAAIAWQTILVARHASIARLYFGFDTRLDTLLMGCLLTLAPLAKLRPFLARHSLFPVLALLTILMSASWTSPILYPWGLLAIGLCAAWVILAAVAGQPEGWLRRLLRTAPLNYCGRVSYGLYLWHFPIAAVAINRFGGQPFGQIKAVAVTAIGAMLAASASYYMLEQPLLRLRR